MSQIAEYSDPRVTANPARVITLSESVTANGEVIRLLHKFPGWECAGSMARLCERECWGAIVTSRYNCTTHGQWCPNETEARRLFDLWRAAPAIDCNVD